MSIKKITMGWKTWFITIVFLANLPLASCAQSIQLVIEHMKQESYIFKALGEESDTIYLLYGGFSETWRDTFQINGKVVFVWPRASVEPLSLIRLDTSKFWHNKAYIMPPYFDKHEKLVVVGAVSPTLWIGQHVYFKKRFWKYKFMYITVGNF
jgi:hypothetical protein